MPRGPGVGGQMSRRGGWGALLGLGVVCVGGSQFLALIGECDP